MDFTFSSGNRAGFQPPGRTDILNYEDLYNILRNWNSCYTVPAPANKLYVLGDVLLLLYMLLAADYSLGHGAWVEAIDRRRKL